MKFLQVCNVGNICGGTAACAWTITHALTGHENVVLFLSPPTKETVAAFAHCELCVESKLTEAILQKHSPDFVILHNTAPNRISIRSQIPSLQYQHSSGTRAQCTFHVACSDWLSQQIPGNPQVLHQPIPIPPQTGSRPARSLDEDLTVGRICTPILRKWPAELIKFYNILSEQFPTVRWEFVGAPHQIQEALRQACHGRAIFHSASSNARELFWKWHAMLYHHPTLTESFGRTVAEAMRAGCVPIVDERGGFLEQIDQAQSGFLCKDPDNFATSLQKIQDPGARLQISQNAKESAAEKFSLESFYGNFRRLLLKLDDRSPRV
ncbi:glycosyltransferase family 4 protein [Thalassoglobus polymorphus]|uniref:glycosyltransferase family 4 protein n=1 Tax=Thalassoglobus polymorphus TaxID=2527994 RepID=UPI0018D23F60|nr:glycosyltransferase family 4 protein [Thalassoglobus polymorphus]